MKTNLESLKKFTKDELVMRVEKLENSNTRLTSELQEFLIETKDVKVEKLAMRLDMLMPIKWLIDFSKQERRDVKDILKQVVQANQEWVEEVVKDFGFNEHKVSDVLHDFRGIYADDEHFLPRIQAEDIIGDFDENGDAMEFTSAWTQGEVKVNGYTNNETYRLCLVLDNTEYWKEDILQTFFRLVREDEFNGNDINIIDWNEVIKRYSDDLIETHIHHHNE